MVFIFNDSNLLRVPESNELQPQRSEGFGLERWQARPETINISYLRICAMLNGYLALTVERLSKKPATARTTPRTAGSTRLSPFRKLPP